MPNLRGASLVGRDEGNHSNAARTGSSCSPRRRRRDLEGVLGPVKRRAGRRKMRDGLASLPVTQEKSVDPAGRRNPVRQLATNTSRCDQQGEKEQI